MNLNVKTLKEMHLFVSTTGRGSCVTQNEVFPPGTAAIICISSLIDSWRKPKQLDHLRTLDLIHHHSDAAFSVSFTFFAFKEKLKVAHTGSLCKAPCDLRAWKHFHLQPNPKQGRALWDWMCHLIPHFVSHYPAVVMLTPV